MFPGEGLQLLFLPGFSTRAEAGEVSGRGIGLDAVAEVVRGLGGDVAIRSVPGQGSTVTLDLPVARSADRVLVCTVGEIQVALPAAVVRTFRRADGRGLVRHGGRNLIEVDGRVLAVEVVGRLLGEDAASGAVLVECQVGGAPLNVLVDEVVGEEEVLLRPLPPAAGLPACFDTIALLSSGRPVPVLAPHRLRVAEEPRAVDSSRCAPARPAPAAAGGRLAGDPGDAQRRLLEDAGFVVTAPRLRRGSARPPRRPRFRLSGHRHRDAGHGRPRAHPPPARHPAPCPPAGGRGVDPRPTAGPPGRSRGRRRCLHHQAGAGRPRAGDPVQRVGGRA